MKENALLALANPLAQFLEKEPGSFTRKDLLRVVESKQIERLTFHYTALDGKLKEMKIPVISRNQVDEILAMGERVDGSSLFKGMVDMGLSDLYIVPHYRSAFINPFDPLSLDFICRYFSQSGEPAPFCPDNVLLRSAENFKNKTGYELRALGELEFFLLSERYENIYPGIHQRGYHSAAPFFKSGAVLDQILRIISQVTGAVKYVHSEVGYIEKVTSDFEEINGRRAEQAEVEFMPAPVEDMGDYLVVSRWIIRNIAYRYGLIATFVPKLNEGVAGNGLHFHLELHRHGRSVMSAEDGSLSGVAKRMIGGLCEYADSLTAFGNTVASSYLRLVPDQEAPTRVCWSDLNRSALIRVPLGWRNVGQLAEKINPSPETSDSKNHTDRQTVELRTPDGSALIHLMLAGITMAVDWAIAEAPKENRDPLELASSLYVKGNIFADKKLLRQLPILPGSCVQSAKLLLKKRHLYERERIFPPSVVEYVANLLTAEDDDRLQENFFHLPEDKRLPALRRIMHKDLHRH